MVVKNITSLNDLQEFTGDKVTVIHFYVDWSEECKNIENILEVLSGQAEYKDIIFRKCAAENLPEVSLKYAVAEVPTVLFLKGGKEIDKLVGADPSSLNEKLAKFAKKEAKQSPNNEVKNILSSESVVACIAGEAQSTNCRSSKELLSILEKAKIKYNTYNVSSDNSIAEKLKSFSNCSSFPQLYINGEFVGDLETVKQLSTTGELSKRIEAAKKNLSTNLVSKLLSLTCKSDIMVFMKGEKDAPRCGFSRQLMEILKETGLPFATFDILTDEEVRQGLKVFSDWPTYPQVYVKGELVGGLDIIKSFKEDGELLSTLKP